MQEELKDIQFAENLQNLVPGANCLVYNVDCYVRAKVVSIEDDKVACFVVDNGILNDYEKDEVFKIPARFVNMLPFQVISCKLTGIAPKSGKTWSDEETMKVEDFVNNNETMVIRVTSKMENSEDNDVIAYNSYEILLASESDVENNYNINRKLIDDGIVAKDPWTHALLDAKIELAGDEYKFEPKLPMKIDEENLDVVISDDIVNFLNSIGYDIDPNVVNLLNEPPRSELVKNESTITSDENAADPVEETLNDSNNKYLLEYAFNFPQIEWQQSESVIKLKVSAFDCLDYSFDLNEQYLILM